MRRHILNGMAANPAFEGHHMELPNEIRRPAARRMASTCMAKNPRLDPKAGARIAVELGTTRAYIPVAETLAGNPRLTDETLAQRALNPEGTDLPHRVISNPAAGDNALIAAANRSRITSTWRRRGQGSATPAGLPTWMCAASRSAAAWRATGPCPTRPV